MCFTLAIIKPTLWVAMCTLSKLFLIALYMTLIKVVISKSVFTKSPAIDYECYEFQGYSIITIQDCIFTNITNLYGLNLISLNTENCVNRYKGNKERNQVNPINCSFINNMFLTREILLYIFVEIEIVHYSALKIYIKGCKFEQNKNSTLISIEYYNYGERHAKSPSVVVTGTNFTFITLRDSSYAIYIV